MRVAFLVADFPCLSETFILNQVTGLLDRGHEVDIYTDRVKDWSRVHPDVKRYRLWDRTYMMMEVPRNYLWRVLKGIWLGLTHVHRAPRLILRSLNPFAYGEQAINLWLFYTAVSLIKQPTSYDIIHCQFGTQGYRGLAFKRLLRPTPKLLVMFRGFDISCYIQDGGDRVYQKLLKHVDYSFANCEFFRQRILALGWNPQKVSVHFSGLDTGKFNFHRRTLEPHEPVKIVTTGRLVEKKGIEYAIRAVAKQAQTFPNLTYSIIGDGHLKESLEALIRELCAESYIHLLGWKDEAEIVEILNDCHLFIAPSVTADDGNQDAPINVLKEAMAMGIPVISTTHGGIPELVEDGVSGFLVPERNVDALSDRLNYLLTHPECWPDMGHAGHDFVEQYFNLNRLNDRLVRLYEQLLDTNHISTQFGAVQPSNSLLASSTSQSTYSLSSEK